MDDARSNEPGGFILQAQNSMPSPAPSTSSSRHAAGLPHPRARSLQPGSSKEDMVRRYVEDKLLQTSRRYVRKFGDAEVDDSIVGYKSFAEVAKDLDSVVNVLWLSGTPALQIPFLLRLASDFTQYVRSFPPAPKASFGLLGKLDHCFASLLKGRDIETLEWLPGFENGFRAGMTTTDMVRCRSLVEQTRMLMVEVLSAGAAEDEESDEDAGDTDMDETDDGGYSDSTVRTEGRSLQQQAWDIDEDRLHLDAARIYENTIVQLESNLGDPLAARQVSDD